MVLARDDFEEQCNFVDVEVPDVECQEVEININPCPFLWQIMGFSTAKIFTSYSSRCFSRNADL